jgi:hypothetical protein
MNQTAIDEFSVTRRVSDPRADGGARVVHLGAKQIVIERTVRGVRMAVAVPVAAYVALVVSVRLQDGKATLTLRHEDRDLDVPLGSGEALAIAREAKAWGALFNLAVDLEQAGVPIYTAFPRELGRVKRSRRSAFAKRRKVGVLSRLAVSFGNEHEIIART